MSDHGIATIASTIAAHAYLGGICSNGHPARDVRVDMQALADRLGADTPLTEAMDRVRCAVCGGRVRLRVSALDADRVGMSYGRDIPKTEKPPTRR